MNYLLTFVLLLALADAWAEVPRVRILAEQFWPYSFTPSAGLSRAPAGICVDFSIEVLEAAGVEAEVSMLPWPRVMKHLREDANQLVITMIRSAERENLVHWVGPVARIRHALYGKRTNGKEFPVTLAEAQHLTVASVANDVAHDYLTALGFSRIINTSNYLKGLEMLVRGRVDLYPGNQELISYQCTQLRAGCAGVEPVIPLPELEQDLYLALSASTDEALVEKVRDAYQRLVKAGRLEAISQTYFDSP